MDTLTNIGGAFSEFIFTDRVCDKNIWQITTIIEISWLLVQYVQSWVQSLVEFKATTRRICLIVVGESLILGRIIFRVYFFYM